ncbi:MULTISPECIES: MbeB family mobilization protein, partial [Klebsiella pneumoniae complex]
MSEILNLAKGFEEKSKQQAQDTEQSVKREFARLETSISAELQSSSQSISNAIREQNGRLTGMLRASVSTAMAWIFICFALLIGILSGIIWFQGTIITS